MDPPESRPRMRLIWLWPLPVGLVLGATILAPLARGPGDPSGHIIGAAVGGAVGFILALVWRLVASR